MESMMNIAQIGCGYWGPNLLRNFSLLPAVRVKYLADFSPERRSFVEKNFPHTQAITEVGTIWGDPEIDGVIIATPAASHFELAKQALLSGKHVLVEKPLATKVSEVDELEQIALANQLVLMAGHTFIYNAAVRYVKQLIQSGALGEIRYIYSQRLNLGRIRSDIDALWNFAPHDISIIQYWLDDVRPLQIRRQGTDYIQEGIEDVVFLNLVYPNKVMAHIHVSWLDPQKVRRMIVVGSRKMVIYDDVAEDKITILDKGIDRKAELGRNMDFDRPQPLQVAYRSGDIFLPKISFIEPLRVEAEHFLECIRTGQAPLTGAAHSRQVVAVLEEASSPQART